MKLKIYKERKEKRIKYLFDFVELVCLNKFIFFYI